MNQDRALQFYTRRQALRALSVLSAASLFGCSRDRGWQADAIHDASAAAIPSCIVRPEQTEGPYFVDEKLNRSDIRSDPFDNSIKPGVPLRLEFQVSRVAFNSCTPLAEAMVDIWHCDALGAYSGVHDFTGDTRGKKFLRGYQLTDAAGNTSFLTIYPGWYEGRAVHIHFKIRSDASIKPGFDFTSQLYFDDSISERVHSMAPYLSKGRRIVTNDRDGIFRRGGKQLMPALTEHAQGYVAKFAIGLRVT
ncbi:MAG: intradiol ring-cleavage dioxygenase [Candidatus Binatia bacterium]